MALIGLSDARELHHGELLEGAAAAASQAVAVAPSDLTTDERVWSSIFQQYCYWRLGRPGVSSLTGRYYIWGDQNVVAVDVPDLNTEDSASRLIEAATA